MPRYINVKGHGVVGFPDGMSDEDISAALRKAFPPPEPGIFSTTFNAAKEAFASQAAKATMPDAPNANLEAKSPEQRDRIPDLTPGSADMSASEYWQRVAQDASRAMSPELNGNIIDNPELLANPKFYARGLGGLAGGLPFMFQSGLERGREIQDQTGSNAKGAAVGLGETALNLLPFGEGWSRLARAGLFGAASGAAPVIEAAATGSDMTQALKEAATAAVPGAILGAALPGRVKARERSAPDAEREFRDRLGGLTDEPQQPAAPRSAMPTPEELAALTEAAAERRTADIAMERRLRTEAGIPEEPAAPPVETPPPSSEGLSPDELEARRVEAQLARRGVPTEAQMAPAPPDPYSQRGENDLLPGDIEAEVAFGQEGDANFIPWDPVKRDPVEAMRRYEQRLEAEGWKADRSGKGGALWQKGDAQLFLRSQGADAPPIVQWKKIDMPIEAKLRIAEYRDALAGMRKETGWAEVGGRGIQNEEGANIGRTSWVPRAEWWKDRPKGLNEGQVKDAIAKALTGEPLKKQETRMIEYMLKWVDQQKAAAKSQELGDLGAQEPFYHGSQHRFSQFDMSKVGTGQGAQTYGYGLYFAKDKEIAGHYRQILAGDRPIKHLRVAGQDLFSNGRWHDYSPRDVNNVDHQARALFAKNLLIHEADLHEAQKRGELKEYVARRAKEMRDSAISENKLRVAHGEEPDVGYPEAYQRIYDYIYNHPNETKLTYGRQPGALYHVEIPDETIGKMLLHDEILSKQPEPVKEVARDILKRAGYLKPHENGPIMLNRAWRSYSVEHGSGGTAGKGGQVYQELSHQLGGDKQASEYLLSKGVPGIKYLDSNSRTGEKASHNIVVFDDKLVQVMKVEEPRRAYKGVKVQSADGKQLAFDFATRPESTPRQVELGRSAVQHLLDSWTHRTGTPVRLLALDLAKEFTDKGTVSLVGKKVVDADTLAALGQVFRDPRYETLRFFLTKKGVVVHQVYVSSRLPAAVNFSGAHVVARMRTEMLTSGADGYFVLHNHPSGRPVPSGMDIELTQQLDDAVRGMQAHVVVDNQAYSVISPRGEVRHVNAPELGGYVTGKNPTLSHDILGEAINGSVGMARVAKMLEVPANHVTIVGADVRGTVRAAIELPASAFSRGRRGAAIKATTVALLNRFSRNSGSAQLHAIGKSVDPLRSYQRAGLLGFIVEDGRIYGGEKEYRKNSRRMGYGLDPDKLRAKDGHIESVRESDLSQPETRQQGEQRPDRIKVGGGDYSNRQFGKLTNDELGVLNGVMRDVEAPIKGERRGTRTWDKTEEAALRLVQQKYGVTLTQLISRKKGSTANAEQLEAYGMILANAAKEVTATMEKVMQSGADQDLIALAAAREKLGVLVAPAMGYKTEAGRSLNILRKAAQDWKTAQKLVEQMPEGGIEAMRQYAKGLKKAGTNLDEVIGITRESYKPTLGDKFNEYWINGLLSGPTTHTVNIASNALFNMLELGAEAAAAAVSKHAHWNALSARVTGMMHGVSHGLAAARVAFLTEEPQLNPVSKLELEKRRAIGGKLGRFIRIPGRALMAEDEFFKALAYHGELGARAMEEAIASGAPDRFQKFADIMGDVQNRPDLIEHAKLEADRATFQDKLDPFMQTISNLRYKGGPGSWFLQKIIPFVRTPVNILKRAVEYSPAAGSLKQVRDALKAGGKDRAMAVSRMMVGSTLMLAGMSLTSRGVLTGNGPQDPSERALLMRTGWQPYSIKVGDQWVRYNRFDPIGMILGVSADMYDIGSAGSEGDWDKVGSLAMTSIALNLGDKTFLRGVSDFTQAYTDPKRYFARWVSGLTTSAIPNVVAQTARGIDPYMRDARSFTDQILAKLPGAREQLATKLDIAGEPIREEGDFPGNPLRNTPMKDDALAGALLKLGLNKSMPDRKLTLGKFEIPLEGEDYKSYASYVQQARWRLLTPFVKSPQFQQLMAANPEQAAELVDKQWTAIGAQARKAWIESNPGVLAGAKHKQAVGSQYQRYTEMQQ